MTSHPSRAGSRLAAGTVIEIVIPIHDEAAVLETSVRRVHDHVRAELPFRRLITVADNASTDASPRIGRALAAETAIGSRLARGAHVVRGPKREVVSRCNNRLLRTTLGAGFSDAQCGFKAIRTDVAALLLPQVRDEAWFFDTELLVLAQRAGLGIHEVPVDWVDDPDSGVDIVPTACADLRGRWRIRNVRPGPLPLSCSTDTHELEAA